jgi:hypothetical protein
MTDAPKVLLRNLDDLTPDPRNARTHSEAQVDQIAQSIGRFGWTNPVLADDLIRAGHGRTMAARAIYADGGTIYLAPGKERGGKAIPAGTVPVIDCTGWTEEERKAYALADNQLALQAGWDTEILMAQLDELSTAEFNIAEIGFDMEAIDALGMGEIGTATEAPAGKKAGGGSLAAEFMIPPFTVLNAREGWWMDRKRAWLSLGIKSEVGRGENLLRMSDTMLEPDPEKRAAMQAAREDAKGKARTFGQDLMRGEGTNVVTGKKKGLGGVTMDALSSHPRYYEQKTAAEAKVGRKLTPEEFERDHWVLPDSELSSGTSIFDPVLCELAYRWFSPVGGRVLDPFAGGSVRGIVCAALGRRYVGVDLRAEQIEANRAQWPAVADKLGTPAPRAAEEVPALAEAMHAYQRPDGDHRTIRVVRDDRVLGGTKRRALDRIVAGIDAEELVYATPAYGFAQIALAGACRAAGKRATIFVAARSERHPRTQLAADLGANVIEVKAGRLNVIQSRARKHCEATGAYLVPFGMDDEIFVDAMAQEIAALPGEAPTEVWCVAGSGTLTRALQRAFPDAEHHAVQIGRDPDVGNAKLWKAPEAFEEDATDPPPFPSCSNYDAKAWRFIRENASPGALFWNLGADSDPAPAFDAIEPEWHVGDSNKVLADDAIGGDFDFVFSCPPYGDLEVYSDDPDDISTLEQSAFDAIYADIIAKAVARLADNRFACFVVGDYRDKRGIYANFVSKTIAAFEAAGAPLYNEAILITSVGSLPIRTAKQFRSTRKLGKTHQNILVFVKGNPRLAVEALGPVDVDAGLARFLDDEASGQPEE